MKLLKWLPTYFNSVLVICITDFANIIDENLLDRIKDFANAVDQFKLISLELGYPPHGSLFPGEIIDLVNSYHKFGIEEIRQDIDRFYIEKYNNEELDIIFNTWVESLILQNRKPIIKEIIKSHKEGNYFLSIAVIIAQMEGIIAEVFNHKGYIGGHNLQRYLKQLLSNQLNLSFDKSIKAFYISVVLAGFEHGKPIQSFLSRNAILHGADIKYGTLTNSIKAILLFDYLYEKLLDFHNSNNHHNII